MDKLLIAFAGMLAGAFYIVVGAVFLGLLSSIPVWLMWNHCLIDIIPGLHKIGWLQSWGLFVLCHVLFKTHTGKD